MRLISLLLTAVLFGATCAYAEYDEAKVIAYTKQILVSKLDPKLPKQPLESWLKKLAGKRKISWEVNDCGEGSGGGKDEDVSLCGAFTVDISDAEEFEAYISVGSVKQGVIGNDSNWPHLFWAFISKKDSSGHSTSDLKMLPGLLK